MRRNVPKYAICIKHIKCKRHTKYNEIAQNISKCAKCTKTRQTIIKCAKRIKTHQKIRKCITFTQMVWYILVDLLFYYWIALA